MVNNFYGKSANIIIKLCRKITRKYKIINGTEVSKPAVYIVHHQNLRGPITTMLWLDTPKHIWVLNYFCNRKSCFSQYTGYTFTKRFGMPKVLAAVSAYPLSFIVSKLMCAIKAIPVFRGTRNIIKTINQSVDCLKNGESILICPDVDYKSKDTEMGPMYDGFLNIDKYYFKETGCHIPFVPIHINKNSRSIYIGNEILFEEDKNYKAERQIIYKKLKSELLRLELLDKNKNWVAAK